MTEEAGTAPKQPKESEVLTQASLIHLARGLGKESNGLTFPMLLNIPTTTIVNIIYENNENGLLNDDGTQQCAVVEKCLLLWRKRTTEQKNKDRVKSLEKAMREMGKMELADLLMERFQNHQEITPDFFA
ncbi:hypothetical protein BaRGS_00019130 [Batillaria attramentaria]|uniref:Death domain-containing protein n=1 Tax=Batillaria attramentaria TaxID=370345 RepID=A0ABD0KR35_9CAEN